MSAEPHLHSESTPDSSRHSEAKPEPFSDHHVERVHDWAAEQRRNLLNSDTYLIPCPMCSYLNAELEVIRRPIIIPRRLIHRFALEGCGGSCELCDPRAGIIADTEAQVAAAWTHRLAHLDQIRGLTMLAKCRRTLRRLAARGEVPESFPLPPEEA